MKKSVSYLKVSVLALAAAAFLSHAKADETLISLADGTTGNANEGSFGELVIGVGFTLSENVTVTQLGAYAADYLTDQGVTSQDFTAVLYDNFTYSGGSPYSGVGTVLASADIAAGTSVDSQGIAFTTLGTPITLTEGTQYFIGAIGGTPSDFGDTDGVQWGSGLNNFAANSGALTTPSIVTLDTSGYSSDGPFTGAHTPSSVAAGTVQNFTISNVYFAGDLRYAVPEPSDFAYLAVGGLVVSLLLRRKICR